MNHGDETTITTHKPWVYRDNRGLFFESYPESFTRPGRGLGAIKIPPVYVQDNVSISKKGVVRGMHFQRTPMEQGKFIRCIQGAIFDRVINIKTGEVHEFRLDEFEAMYVPPGYAHGFQAMHDNTIVYYKCTQAYSKEHEDGFNPLDFDWPVDVTEVSEKDRALPRFK